MSVLKHSTSWLIKSQLRWGEAPRTRAPGLTASGYWGTGSQGHYYYYYSQTLLLSASSHGTLSSSHTHRPLLSVCHIPLTFSLNSDIPSSRRLSPINPSSLGPVSLLHPYNAECLLLRALVTLICNAWLLRKPRASIALTFSRHSDYWMSGCPHTLLLLRDLDCVVSHWTLSSQSSA